MTSLKSVFIAIIIFQFSFSTSLLSQYDSLFVDSRYRTFLVHTPSEYSGLQKIPLIVAMHGGFGSAFNLQNQSLLSVKANQEHFIVVYPEGAKGGIFNIRTWNAGVCCGHAATSNIDDVQFIDELIQYMMDNYAVDEHRIYATGMSNGGFMAYRLACELPDKIAAIAPVAASMTMDMCMPSSPVPIIHFHSVQDANVLYEGGYGSGASSHYSPPLDSIFNVWSGLNNCSIENDTLIENNDYTLVNWRDCDCTANIEYYLTEDGAHSWPGGNATPMGDPVSQVINANDKMWDFFIQYSNDCFNVDDGIDVSNQAINIYPNPMIDELTIEGDLDLYDIQILNRFGFVVEELIATGTSLVLDLNQLPQGLYFILLQHKSNSLLTVQNIIKM